MEKLFIAFCWGIICGLAGILITIFCMRMFGRNERESRLDSGAWVLYLLGFAALVTLLKAKAMGLL